MLRECLKQARPTTTPNPLSDSLRDFYLAKLPGGKGHAAMVHAGRLRDALQKPDMKLDATNGQLLELYVTFRNAKLGHGASLTEPEYAAFFGHLEPLLTHLLGALDFVVDYPLTYVQEVRVQNQAFVHRAESCMGRDFEAAKFQTSTSPLNDHEVYLCHRDGQSIDFALSLSPYLIVDQCHECKQQQVFFFNSMKGKRLDYLSYQCGHDFSPAGYVADFDDIREFLAGNVSTAELFRGKVFGREPAGRVLVVSAADKDEAKRKLTRAKELAADRTLALARKELGEAIDLDADLAEAWFVLGCVAILEDDDIEAVLSSMRTAVRLDPENAAFLMTLARTEAILERPEPARETLQRVLAVDPASSEARALLASLPVPLRDAGAA